jgi:hypothetical protein
MQRTRYNQISLVRVNSPIIGENTYVMKSIGVRFYYTLRGHACGFFK